MLTKRIQTAYQVLGGLGWSTADIQGILANMLGEDSQLDPTQVGDGGSAYGIGQWHPDRQAAFQKIFGHPIQQSTFEEQLKFYSDELNGLTGDSGAAAAGRLLHSNKYNAGQDAAIVSVLGERPAAQMEAATNRAKTAMALDASYGAPTASRQAASVTINQKTTITAPSSVTAQQLADHQGRVNTGLARNIKSAVDGGH
jgi:hypothetical protein